MKRAPTPTQLDGQLDELAKMLPHAKRVMPVLAEQARLESRELHGGLPTSTGADWSGDPPPAYADPTGEDVVRFDAARRPRPGEPDPAVDLERLAGWYGDVTALVGSTRRLLNQVPAVTLAVVDGRRPTDGRSAEEHEQRRFVRAITESRCLVGEDHDDDDRYGPGQLRAGMCDRHRKGFARWAERYPADRLPTLRAEQVVRWRAETYVCPTSAAVVVEMSAYRSGLREVA